LVRDAEFLHLLELEWINFDVAKQQKLVVGGSTEVDFLIFFVNEVNRCQIKTWI
jgi:hypothetical protein